MLKRLLFWTAIICSLLHEGYYAKKTAGRPPRRPRPPPPPPRPPSLPLAPSSKTAPATQLQLTPTPHRTPSPPTPTPHITPSPPPIPVPLSPNQCSFGAENAYTLTDFRGHMETDVLYLLVNHPADCAGFIDSLEFCYFYNTTEAMNSSYTIHLLSFRPLYYTSGDESGDIELYRKLSGASVDIAVDSFNKSKGGGTRCQVIEPEDRLSLSEGDVIGFVTEQGFNMALMASDEKGIFQYVPSDSLQQQFSLKDVLELESILTTQLKQANNTATPVLKIVMSKCLLCLVSLMVLLASFFIQISPKPVAKFFQHQFQQHQFQMLQRVLTLICAMVTAMKKKISRYWCLLLFWLLQLL